MSENEKEKGEWEKLIDWEQNKQLTWAVVLLTATLGLAGILFTNSFSTITRAFVIVLGLTLMLVLDLSFYRLATTLVNLRRYVERIGQISELYRKELLGTKDKEELLKQKDILERLYDWFVDASVKYKPRLITWRAVLIIVLADFFILSYMLVMILPIGLAEFFIFLCGCVLILQV
jgi:hypothetical protein